MSLEQAHVEHRVLARQAIELGVGEGTRAQLGDESHPFLCFRQLSQYHRVHFCAARHDSKLLHHHLHGSLCDIVNPSVKHGTTRPRHGSVGGWRTRFTRAARLQGGSSQNSWPEPQEPHLQAAQVEHRHAPLHQLCAVVRHDRAVVCSAVAGPGKRQILRGDLAVRVDDQGHLLDE